MAVQGAHRLPAFALYLLSVHARSLPHTFFHLFSFVFSFSPSAASLHPTFSYFTQTWARRYVFYSAASKWWGGGDEKESLGVYVRVCVYVCDAGEGCGVIGHARCLSVECSIGLELSLNMDEKESRGWCSRKIPPSVRLCLNNTKPLCFNTHSHTHAHTLSHGTRQLHCHHTQSEKEREWNWGRESKRERRGLTAGMEGRMRWRCPPLGYEPGEKGWLATFLDGSRAPMISLQSGIAHRSRLSASMAIWTKPPARYSRMGKRFCPLLLTCWMRVRMSWPFRFASFLLSPFSFPILRWRLFVNSVRRRGLLVLAVCLGQALLFTCRVCVCVCVCVCVA